MRSSTTDIDKAKALATLMLAGKTDKADRPMIDHCERVASRVHLYGEITLAYLHDLIEDTAVTLDDLLAFGFSAEMVGEVDTLTRRESETYAEYIERVRTTPGYFAVSVKIADLLDHLDETSSIPASLVHRYDEALEDLSRWRSVQGFDDWKEAEAKIEAAELKRKDNDTIQWLQMQKLR